MFLKGWGIICKYAAPEHSSISVNALRKQRDMQYQIEKTLLAFYMHGTGEFTL